jgi:hypothetical protein
VRIGLKTLLVLRMQSTLNNYPWCKEIDSEVRELGLGYDEELMLGMLWDCTPVRESQLVARGVHDPPKVLLDLRRLGWDATSQANGPSPSKKTYCLANRKKRWRN